VVLVGVAAVAVVAVVVVVAVVAVAVVVVGVGDQLPRTDGLSRDLKDWTEWSAGLECDSRIEEM